MHRGIVRMVEDSQTRLPLVRRAFCGPDNNFD
jgi:hypothetical protein